MVSYIIGFPDNLTRNKVQYIYNKHRPTDAIITNLSSKK
jgi:hypothetical protein